MPLSVFKHPINFVLFIILFTAIQCSGQSHPKHQKDDMKITSSAFKEGRNIPATYTCTGTNISPQLSWSGVPDSAKTLALIVDDPDAPSGTWVHWVAYNIPVTRHQFEENLSKSAKLADGTLQGINDFHNIGYGGPCPPPGPAHHYHFKLYALDTHLDLSSGLTKSALLSAMKGHVIAQGELTGSFKKP